jgi:hypothetical protein
MASQEVKASCKFQAVKYQADKKYKKKFLTNVKAEMKKLELTSIRLNVSIPGYESDFFFEGINYAKLEEVVNNFCTSIDNPGTRETVCFHCDKKGTDSKYKDGWLAMVKEYLINSDSLTTDITIISKSGSKTTLKGLNYAKIVEKIDSAWSKS